MAPYPTPSPPTGSTSSVASPLNDFEFETLVVTVGDLTRTSNENPGIVLDYELMRLMATSLSGNPAWKVKWLEWIRRAEKNHTGLAPRFQRVFKRSVGQQFDLSLRSPSTRPALKAFHARMFPEHVENFHSRNPYWWVKDLIVEGHSGYVQGDRGFGKTDFALVLSNLARRLKAEHNRDEGSSELDILRQEAQYSRNRQTSGSELSDALLPEVDDANGGGGGFGGKMGLYHARDIRFPTNISIDRASPLAEYYQPIARMSDLVIAMSRNALEHYFNLVILDEMGFSFNRRRAMTTQNFSIEQILIVLRKWDAALLVIAQSVQQQLPESLVQSAQFTAQKLNKREAVITVRGLMHQRRVRAIPRISPRVLRFATRSFAPFKVDMLPSLMVDQIAEQERLAGAAWSDERMYRAAIEFAETARTSTDALGGVIVAQVKYLMGLVDEAGKPYSAAYIARELETDVEKVRIAMEEVRKAPRERRIEARPVLPPIVY